MGLNALFSSPVFPPPPPTAALFLTAVVVAFPVPYCSCFSSAAVSISAVNNRQPVWREKSLFYPLEIAGM